MSLNENDKNKSQPRYGIKVEKNVRVKMRDGLCLAVDVFRPDAEEKFPALLSMSPYSKDIESLKIPPAPMPGAAEYSHIEAGDTEYFVCRGYAHIIADVRGTGYSEGRYDICSTKEQEDGYDLVEWIAQQQWCDGNVGMVGISYLALIQYLVAAQQPPHLKAIFAHDGWNDMYRDVSHHGGILMHGWLPGWMEHIVAWDPVPVSTVMYSKEELSRRVEKCKNNEVVNKFPFLYAALEFPQLRPIVFDWFINEFDGPYYWERSAYTKFDKIKVPVYLGSQFYSYAVMIHLPGAFRAYASINTPKKLVIRKTAPGRPFYDFHDEIVRWYDHWLKGINTGIMDEPPVKIWVREAEKWKYGQEWPLAETKWTDYYLGANNHLMEKTPIKEEEPDSFNHKPVRAMIDSSAPTGANA